MPYAYSGGSYMPISQQRINSLKIKKLKNLKNCNIDLSNKPLVAIMGVNGVGKSTILHALACCYKPTATPRKDYKFSEFFLPNTYALWNDSDFSITCSYRDDARFFDNIERQYKKQERWSPRYVNRPERYVSFIGISSCVPDVEVENYKSFLNLELHERRDDTSRKILTACSYVLNIPYQRMAICESRFGKEYLSVLREEMGYCTSLSMGAGEQRVFRILSEAYRCPKYSLLLIDELDLLLHENALKRIIQKLHEIAADRNLQIVFTTHSMLMMDLMEYVDIQYLTQTPTATLVQTAISTDSILQLTGNVQRPISIYVEDSLSQTIVNQLCAELNCKRYVQVFRFGPAINAFTVIAGKVLNNELGTKTIAILDGDLYISEAEKMERIQSVITGQAYDYQRQQVLHAILQYQLPAQTSPESFIRNSILALPNHVFPEHNEFRIVLNEIGIVDNTHRYIDDATRRLDMDYQVGLSKIVEFFSKTDEWNDFSALVRNWIETAIRDIHLV